ncbi:phosphatase PAP2 family protein [Amycolatopsis pithecellobii]|uniref:phosphatase PAP2 family protein n=1 Tax=Amycolatopsis pithecellobii TaxID=664692 RepID=UPI0028AEA518|nr:phosphatase PAP2 family protein [Amycolatopsis pithecellobii]
MTGVLFLGLFVALGLAVAKQPLGIDLTVTGAFQGLWRGTFGNLTKIVSDLLGLVLPAAAVAGLLVGAILAWYRGLRREALIVVRVLVVYGAARLTSWLGKPIFVRERPRAYAEFSYPSGHVVAIASTALAATLLCRWLAPALTRRVAVGSGLLTVLVALTRLVLGVHWLSDTVGAVLGVLGVGLLAAAVVRLLPGPVPERRSLPL